MRMHCGLPGYPIDCLMSAIGPKQTWTSAPHMSAFGGKADMTLCGNPLSRSLLGVKRTSLFAAHMSAYDPKRTCRSTAIEAKFTRHRKYEYRETDHESGSLLWAGGRHEMGRNE